MKKIYLVAIAALSITALSLSACQNDVESVSDSSTLNNDSIVLHSKYMTPAQILNLSTTRAADVSNKENPTDVEGNYISIDIVKFHFGKRAAGYTRSNRECEEMHAHLCYAEWFPMSEIKVDDFNILDNQVSSVLEKKENGEYYVNILLAEEPTFPETFVPYISVDEDETYWGTKSLNSTEFTTVQGTYLFNRNLGPFGGYKINIEVND